VPEVTVNAASTAPAGARTVRCPTCGGASVYSPANAFRPFCSERCKNLDLGAWASEAYRVEVKPEASPDEGAAPEK
jgi:endogenous inhibitor of DNA gyrase (YacG/DUF329 family)